MSPECCGEVALATKLLGIVFWGYTARWNLMLCALLYFYLRAVWGW